MVGPFFGRLKMQRAVQNRVLGNKKAFAQRNAPYSAIDFGIMVPAFSKQARGETIHEPHCIELHSCVKG